MMVNINRELAQPVDWLKADDQVVEQMIALMTISKVYDQGAKWPARPVGAMEYIGKLEKRAAKVPLAALLKMMGGIVN